VAVGLAELLEGGATSPQTKSALALLATDGKLASAAREQPAGEQNTQVLDRLVAHWRGTDRTLHPFLDWLEAVGLTEPVQFARGKRRQAARAVTDKGGPVALHERRRPYFTRATYQRLRGEAEKLQLALRTTIPQAIQKARELGDLRENAEYESAKLKQRQTQARLEQLAERIEGALLIDDLEISEDKAGLGTEIDLEFTDGRSRRVWLLGDGDDSLGAEVVSYRAPLGRALLDKSPGETLEIPTDGSTETATVRAVRRRLPAEAGEQTAAD
jgi:transcription elongation factor GreA